MDNSPSASPQSVTIGEGALHRLGDLLTQLKARRIFFVVDKPAYEHSGAAGVLKSCLKSREVTWFSDFEINPKIEDVGRGVELFRKKTHDAVLGLGGGSALDMAKLIAGCGSQPKQPVDYTTGKNILTIPPPPIVAMPTTSGTGSEATHFAVVYVDGQKFSLAHSFLLPAHVIVDPELTYSLPARITAACGLDALCQSIESIWAAGSTNKSVQYASEGLQLALNYLEKAVRHPDPEARSAMARAAHLSGKAINISKTTAPHAVSYGITTGFQVPHGMAVALTSGAFLEYNYRVDEADCTDPRGAAHVKERINLILKLMKSGSPAEAVDRLKTLMQAIGCPIRLSETGIKKTDLPVLAGQVNAERLSNNPRRIDAEGLIALLESIF